MSQPSKFLLTCFLFLGIICALFSTDLSAATINVPADQPTIQAAVNAANNGDTIQIAAGTYVEQVQIINKSLTIIGAGIDETIIASPPAAIPLTLFYTYEGTNFWCVVIVDNQAAPTAQTVDISNLTIDGTTQQDTTTLPNPPTPGFYGNDNRFFALGYHNASGTVNTIHTTNTRQTSNFNELAGGGIENSSDVGTVTFTVTNCLIDFYQREGIDGRGTALTATISNNTVNRGYVLTPNTSTAGPNGIELSRGCVGSITNNTVELNISTVPDAAASGIITYQTGDNVIVSGNTLSNNDEAIVSLSCGNNFTIQNNTINFTTTPGVNAIFGLDIEDNVGVTNIISNTMNNLPNTDMYLFASTNQSFALSNNQFIGSQVGLQVQGATTVGPVVTMDSDSFTGQSLYYIQEITAPNDIWPSTASVSFDGLVSGHITMAEYDAILTKIYDQHNDPTLGLVLAYIPPSPPVVTSIAPTSGTTAGGNIVTITGTNFLSSNTQVFFGTTPATNVVVVSDTEITVTAPAGTGTVDVTVTTPFGTSPIVSTDAYTYTAVTAPLPPSHFVGILKKCPCPSRYVLYTTWDRSPSPNVVSYQIFKGNVLVAQVPANAPLVFKTRVNSKAEAKTFQIVAVNSDNVLSTPVAIHIKGH